MAQTKPKNKILILGSGLVAKPCVDYLLRNPHNQLSIGTRDPPTLDPLIASHDVVVSLVPFIHHPAVIRSAVKGRTHVVTTSYASPAIRELDAAARDAGITVLNEVGVDPGVDHLYAVKTIGEVHERGGRGSGGDNPLRFKFSWSPRGVLLSQYNPATFYQDGERVHIPNTELTARATPYYVMDGYSFVAYPNRDSTPFREFYNIPEAKTVIRGSLRYKGDPALVRALISLGWLDSSEKEWLEEVVTWAEVQQRATGAASSAEEDLVRRADELCTFTDDAERTEILDGLRWMGCVASVHGNLVDTLSVRLEKLCSFEPGERDLVMLQHKFVVRWKDGSEETIMSTLELLGEPGGYSAMSKSVGVTCGIATQVLLDGFGPLNQPGVVVPYTKEICDP
ncbi:saccharopine dehydrogenase [Cercophora newfieldiana]|uniref:Saccharopine dehydrogenase n=1 Tax=Cercophora newfieldiana TaxID=92897 RepID=A0AA39YF63_9PEZI|nr:saccharopine dehydrogenase [Cercophora newfieldiana]